MRFRTILYVRLSLKKTFQKKIDRGVLQENKIQFQKQTTVEIY
jgi:hypothetical protein